MGDKGKRDKGKREEQKKGKHNTLKEKRKKKKDKEKQMTSPDIHYRTVPTLKNETSKAIVDTPSVNEDAQYHFGDDRRISFAYPLTAVR